MNKLQGHFNHYKKIICLLMRHCKLEFRIIFKMTNFNLVGKCVIDHYWDHMINNEGKMEKIGGHILHLSRGINSMVWFIFRMIYYMKDLIIEGMLLWDLKFIVVHFHLIMQPMGSDLMSSLYWWLPVVEIYNLLNLGWFPQNFNLHLHRHQI